MRLPSAPVVATIRIEVMGRICFLNDFCDSAVWFFSYMPLRYLLSFFRVIFTLALLICPTLAAGPGELVRQLNDAYVGVFEKVSPSVVVIEIEKTIDRRARSPIDILGFAPIPDNESPAAAELSEGSGIICRADGYIFTNSHVVDSTAKMIVKLRDGRSFPAKLVGNDPMSEIAVLKIEANDLTVADFADSDMVRVGQIACVIGSPYNFNYSFTTGVISGKGRGQGSEQNLLETNRGWSGLFEDFLQTDASINPGNSGGPLLDIEGRVVGMNTLIQGINKGLGFAISSNLLRKIGDELIANGKISRPWLGLGIQSMKDLSERSEKYPGLSEGVIVESLSNDGPALKSELQPSDVILKVDGVIVKETIDLQREVQKKKIGQAVQLVVWREGKELTIPIQTAEMPSNLNSSYSTEDEVVPPADLDSEDPAETPEVITPEEKKDLPETSPNRSLGLEVQVLTPDLALARKLKSKTGLIVTEVTPGSEADVAGVKVGDVVTEVNSQPVSDEKSFSDAFAKSDNSKGTLLFVERDNGSSFLVLKSSE